MTTLRLYNTLTKQKDDFAPLDAKNVRMYVCGPTVYDYAHIGNARPAIVFDVLYRLLKHLYPGKGAAVDGSRVTYVRNITDIDDKINARAAERAATDKRNVPILQVLREITEATYGVYKEDVAALGCLPPTQMPRATEYVKPMIAMIETLIAEGHAYNADDHVLFDISSAPSYGKLSNQNLEKLRAGSRVEVELFKQRNPLDFVLWKPSKENEPGWSSPWGYGRPGWHLECSAMIETTMGETIDIHGGGIDLVFPHHENEIAQSESAHHGHPLARYWIHNGFLNVEGEKMSKSLGNFVTINELLNTTKFGGKRWSGAFLRFSMLQTQYRQPIDWTVVGLEQAVARLERWRQFASERTDSKLDFDLYEQVLSALFDDLNTPKAFGLIDEAIGRPASGSRERYTVYKVLKLLGFKGPSSISKKLADKAKAVERAVAKVSASDWQKIVGEAASEPKQEGLAVDLIANTANLQSIVVQAKTAIEPISKLDEVVEISERRASKLRVFVSHSASDSPSEKVLEKLNKDLVKLYKSLSEVSKNDWVSIVENVRNKPLLNSGDPKAATDFAANVIVVGNLLQQANNIAQPILHLRHIEERRTSNAAMYSTKVETEENGIQVLVDARNAARAAKDFKESDRIRDDLLAKGIVLKDGPTGTTWEVKR